MKFNNVIIPESARRLARVVVVSLLVGLHAIVATACGGDANGAESERFLVVTMVEEQQADGSWVPVADAEIHYLIYDSGDRSGNTTILYDYLDVTDQTGLSVTLKDSGGKKVDDVGRFTMFVRLPDGRDTFMQQKPEAEYDFFQWIQTVLSEEVDTEEAIARICAAAIDFPDCEESLRSNNLAAWGTAFRVQFR